MRNPFNIKLTTAAAALTSACLLQSGCGGGGKAAIQVKGSDTMVNLAQAWA